MATVGRDYAPVLQRLLVVLIVFLFTFVVPWYLYETLIDQDDGSAELLDTEREENPPQEGNPIQSLRITSQPLYSIAPAENYKYTITVDYTGDSENLRYELEQLPEWLQWDADSKTLTGDAPTTDPQSFPIELLVTDGEYSDRQSFAVRVAPVQAETSPTPPLQPVAQGSSNFEDPFAGGTASGNRQNVLGASTDQLPVTAWPPWLWLSLGLSFVVVGSMVWRYYYALFAEHRQQYTISTGGTLEVTKKRSV